MKTSQKLARAFISLAQQGEQIDSTASSVLSIVKGAGAVSEEKFDALVSDAYAANGWNTQVGRPANGAEKKGAAPNTVRTYVTILRRAIRVGLHIGRYDTFTALRTSLEKKAHPRLVQARGASKRAKGRKNGADIARIPKDLQQNFVGIEIETPRVSNGALFHDLAATFVGLKKEEDRAAMGRELAALLHKWLPRAGVPVVSTRRQEAGRIEARKAA